MEAGLPNGVLNVVHGTNVSSLSIFFLDFWMAKIILTPLIDLSIILDVQSRTNVGL